MCNRDAAMGNGRTAEELCHRQVVQRMMLFIPVGIMINLFFLHVRAKNWQGIRSEERFQDFFWQNGTNAHLI